MKRSAGFTLVEVLVALGVMAVLALMSWRGLDAMLRTQTALQQRGDDLRTLQAGLAQWQTDLGQLSDLKGISSWDWDGKVLRLTREGVQASEGLQVVAWSWRQQGTGGDWLRWQSPPLTTLTAWQEAWQNARIWSQVPTEALRGGEVRIHPLAGWQLFVHRGGNWANPLSSDATTPAASSTVSGAVPSGTALASDTAASGTRVPDGVRLVLDLPTNSPLAGRLSLDWVRPTLSAGSP